MSDMPRNDSLIAIVDDDLGVRRALARLVAVLGHQAKTFASGEEFLDSVQSHPPDCVLLDLHLSGMSGIQVIASLRDRGETAPVVIMTGLDETGTRERCCSAGAACYVTKPIERAVLSALLDQVL